MLLVATGFTMALAIRGRQISWNGWYETVYGTLCSTPHFLYCICRVCGGCHCIPGFCGIYLCHLYTVLPPQDSLQLMCGFPSGLPYGNPTSGSIFWCIIKGLPIVKHLVYIFFQHRAWHFIFSINMIWGTLAPIQTSSQTYLEVGLCCMSSITYLLDFTQWVVSQCAFQVSVCQCKHLEFVFCGQNALDWILLEGSDTAPQCQSTSFAYWQHFHIGERKEIYIGDI